MQYSLGAIKFKNNIDEIQTMQCVVEFGVVVKISKISF
jgi:hypothetical protein